MDTTPLLTPMQLAIAFQAAADAHADATSGTDLAYNDRQLYLDTNRQYWHHIGYNAALEAIMRGEGGIHYLTTVAEDAMRGLSLPAGVA